MLDGDTIVFALVPKGQIVDWTPDSWWPGDEDTCWLTEGEAESLINALPWLWRRRLMRNFYTQSRFSPAKAATLATYIQRAATRDPAKLANIAQ